MFKPTRRTLSMMLALACLGGAGNAVAQAYPSKPVTIVVAYPAGGDTDAMARLFAEKLSPRLGQPVVVDNRVGASGTIGTAYVSKANPDGHILLLAPSTFSIAQMVLKTGGSSAYDEVGGFSPIIQTATQPLFVAANAAAGIKDIKQMIEMAKAKPMNYASPGSGSPMHILGEMFNKSAGTKITQVPYRGAAPAVNDLVGGQVPVTFMTIGPLAPFIANGKLVPLAVADAKRSPLAPNVPTLAEMGVKDADVGAWQGLFGPKGMSPELVKTLNGHMNEILKMPDVVAKMNIFGAIPAGGEPARLTTSNTTDHARFGKIIKELGIQAD
jgi:tripartite-type tricarboxylate transporter receptor subunit TctC